ncbi:7TM-DISM domain-containing protein [Algivirga pacifica]|uniref:7TM-DISM receptor extracellular domain-containing protein n=1 Tax=Algivirga pacifica TaxID=1162670 RepID=A0ABP9D8U2_9BACT
MFRLTLFIVLLFRPLLLTGSTPVTSIDSIYTSLDITSQVALYTGKPPKFHKTSLPLFDESLWRSIPTTALSFGVGTHSNWIKVALQSNRSCQKILSFAYPNTPIIDGILTNSKGEIVQTIALGTKRKFDVALPSIYNEFTVRLSLEAKENYTLWVHFNGLGESYHPTIKLSEETYLREKSYKDAILITPLKAYLSFTILLVFALGLVSRYQLFYYYAMMFIGVLLLAEVESGTLWFFFDEDPHGYFFILKSVAGLLILHGSIQFCSNLLLFLHPIHHFHKIEKYLKLPLVLCYSTLILYAVFRQESNLFPYLHTLINTVYGYTVGYIYLIILLFKGIKEDRKAFYISLVMGFNFAMNFVFISLPHLGLIKREVFSDISLYVFYSIEATAFLFLITRMLIAFYREKERLNQEFQRIKLKVSAALLEGQELERQRIGQEISNFIGDNIELLQQSKNFNDTHIKQLIKDTLKTVRDISHHLIAPDFKISRFEYSIRQMIAIMSPQGVKVSVNFKKWPENASPKALHHCYRMIQELLRNSIIHQKVDTIAISFSEENGGKIIYQELDIKNASSIKNTNRDLNSIRSRAQLLQGQLTYSCSKKNGTILIENLVL